MRFLLSLAALLALAACSARPPSTNRADARTELFAADRAFAAATAARGLDGWMEFYADDAVRLRMGRTAVQGLDAVRAYDAGLFADATTRLVWEPTDAGAFADGRHGFTTGRSALLSASGDTLYAGVYVSMWRLDGGRWRVTLDTGADAE